MRITNKYDLPESYWRACAQQRQYDPKRISVTELEAWPSQDHRLWGYVEAQPSGCWEWQGSRDKRGYGKFGVRKRSIGFSRSYLAHRLTYESHYNVNIAPGHELDHLCRNTSCVRPDHLEAVTHQVNMQRGLPNKGKFNASKTHCKRGHELAGENIYHHGGRRHCRACRAMHSEVRRAR